MKNKTLKICIVALLCALCAVGARFPLYGSVALDALPAYLAALLLGPGMGALTGAVGHLLTAVFSGFPMTVPLHLVIAGEMALVCAATAYMARGGRLWLAAAGGFVLNALVSPLIVVVWPGLGWAACLALLPSLVMASAINAGVAAALAVALRKPLRDLLVKCT